MSSDLPEEENVCRGLVISADGPRLTVRAERTAEERAAGNCGACPMKILCKGKDAGEPELPAAAPEGRTYRPGDAVRLAYRQANAAAAALAMFVPPLAGLALGGWAGWRLGGGGEEGNAALLIGCAAGFGLGVGTSWFSARRFGCLKPSVRILPEEGRAMNEMDERDELNGLRERLAAYAEGRDFRFNPDAEIVEGLLLALTKRKEKFGHEYCPCRRPSGDAEKDREIICPCAFHLEELSKDGRCHCWLFVKK